MDILPLRLNYYIEMVQQFQCTGQMEWKNTTWGSILKRQKKTKHGCCKAPTTALSRWSYGILRGGVTNYVIEEPLLINRSPSGMTLTSPPFSIPLVDPTRSASASFHPEAKELSLWNSAERFSFRTAVLRTQSEHLLESSEQSEDPRWRWMNE